MSKQRIIILFFVFLGSQAFSEVGINLIKGSQDRFGVGDLLTQGSQPLAIDGGFHIKGSQDPFRGDEAFTQDSQAWDIGRVSRAEDSPRLALDGAVQVPETQEQSSLISEKDSTSRATEGDFTDSLIRRGGEKERFLKSITSVPDLLSPATVLVACADDRASTLLASSYQKYRELPQENIFLFRCGIQKFLTRTDYEHLLEEPLRLFLKDKKEIRFLVTLPQTPLGILPEKQGSRSALSKELFETDAASLESELALLKQEGRTRSGWIKAGALRASLLTVFRLENKPLRESINHWKKLENRSTTRTFGEWCLLNYPRENDSLLTKIWEHWSRLPKGKTLVPLEEKAGSTSKELCREGFIILARGTLSSLEFNSPYVSSRLLAGGIWWHEFPFVGQDPQDFVEQEEAGFQWKTLEPTFPQSWPSPGQFLLRLFSGASLGEALESIDYPQSWLLSPVGDPMYRPFKANPQLSEKIGINYFSIDNSLITYKELGRTKDAFRETKED